VNDDKVQVKNVPGGYYAVMTTQLSEIVDAWQRFMKWLGMSKYELENDQWMEEHLSLEGDIRIDLYLPIKE